MQPLFDFLQVTLHTGARGVYRHAGWRLKGDNSPFTRLYGVVGGDGFVRHHGCEFRLRPGHAYLIPPYSNLDLGTPREVRIWWVHLDATLAGGPDLFTVLPPLYEIRGGSGRRAAAWLGRILDLRESGRAGAQLECRGLLLRLLGLFYPAGREEASPDSRGEWRRFQPVFVRIREQLAGRLRGGDLAALAGLSRSSFSLRFKSLCGMSPARYIARRRLESARVLLCNPELKLEAVAAATGFHDAFHLSKCFKRFAGVSPREFRRSRGAVLP